MWNPLSSSIVQHWNKIWTEYPNMGTSRALFLSWPGHFLDCLCSAFGAIRWIARSRSLRVSPLFGSWHRHIHYLFGVPLVGFAIELHQTTPPITPSYFISKTSLGDKRPNPPIGFVSNFAPKNFTHIYTTPDHTPLYFLSEVSLSGNYYHILLLSETYWRVLYRIFSPSLDTSSLYVNSVVQLVYRADFTNQSVRQVDLFLSSLLSSTRSPSSARA